MNRFVKYILPIYILFSAFNVYAQDTVVKGKSHPILAGTPSPIDGVVIPEAKVFEYEMCFLDREQCAEELSLEKATSAKAEKAYEQGMDKLAAPTKWYKSNRFHRILGFALGVVVTGAVISIGAKIVD